MKNTVSKFESQLLRCLAFSINRQTKVHRASRKDKWQRMNAAREAGSVMPLVLERHGQGPGAWCELWHCSSSPLGAFVTCTTPQHSGLDVCLGSLSLAQILTEETSVSSLSNHTDAVERGREGGGRPEETIFIQLYFQHVRTGILSTYCVV